MENILDGSLRDWKLDLLQGEFRHNPENGDDVHIHLKTNEIWRPVKRLGSGTFGEVWQQQCIREESVTELRAVKRIRKPQTGFLESSQREVQALATFSSRKKHQNRSTIDDQYEQRFVQFLGWYEDANYLYLAMEFLECGSLQRYFEVRKAPFEEDEAATIIQQVAEALQFIHSKDFIHRNLKPSVFLHLAKYHVDTPGYIAPEMMDSKNYTSAVDVWALGAVAFYLRTVHTPFATWEALRQYRAGQKDFPSRVLGVSTGFCIDFVLGAMRPLPETRLSIQQVLSHDWLHMKETCRNLMAPSLLDKPLPTLSMMNRSTATSSVPTPSTQTNSTRTSITHNQSDTANNQVETRNGRVTGHEAEVVNQEQPIIKMKAEEREQQRLAAESTNKKAPEGQNKRQRELSFFWKKKEEEELKRQEELRRRQEIVKREEEEAEELERQAELERERKGKEELEQARVKQALLQQQQEQQREREKRAREESEDATEAEPKPDAERIKRVKKELKTICMLCGEKFQHFGQLSRHLNTERHRMPKNYWGAGIGHMEFSDIDALEALRGPLE
ncbi:kinase-like domain-containing protein [Neurospora hispaniola]|uniref:non-specific serine/threonine protein kinase n=1 Tax=Neurospora hispaniola TaxID=588809 RepID=A0AAJ0MS59_9PEZI|nr:kinase-like domain-containing protein [Neurospora hispaniola]